MAKTFESPNPDAKVLGQPMIGTLSQMGDTVDMVLKRYGIDQLQPDEWYDLQLYLDILREIAEGDQNVASNLVQVGMGVSEHGALPPEIDSLEKALMSLQTVYDMNHQNGGQAWSVEIVDDNTIHCSIDSPYPHDMDYGIVYGFAKRFSKGERFSVAFEDPSLRNNTEGTPVTLIVKKKTKKK